MRVFVCATAILACAIAACGDEAGVEGTSILEDYALLSRGVVFASAAIVDSNDYDLYWAPVPLVATIDPQPVRRLTHARGHEWQPSVSRGGNGIVFARDQDGIFLINTSGRISRISETTDAMQVRDSLPSIAFEGTKVAWVREDLTKPIGQTTFFETYIMVADYDGGNAHPVQPNAGVVQDAPVWEPEGSSRLAWSEFDVGTLGAVGPSIFGVYLHDLASGTGRYVCRNPETRIDNAEGDRPWAYRCFGEHLAWPRPDVIVTSQDLIEINLTDGTLQTIWPQVVLSVQHSETGDPVIAANTDGFFPAFPISTSYSDDRLIMDGVVSPHDGDVDTLAFYVSDLDGGGVWRLPIDGFRGDLDTGNTNNFLFSLATPQLVP